MMKLNKCDACGYTTTDMSIDICPTCKGIGIFTSSNNPWQYHYKFGITTQ